MIQRRLYRLRSFVLVLSLLVVLAVRNDEVDASLLEPLAQRIGVVGALGDRAFRLYSRPTFGARNLDFGERGFRKRNFSGEPLSSRTPSGRPPPSTSTIHLVPLPRLVLPTAEPPFFAGAKLPSRNVCSDFSNPSPSRAPSSARHASSQTPCSSHVSSAAPGRGRGILVRQKPPSRARLQHHRIPSKQAWFDAQGWPSAGDFCVRRVV